MSNNSNYSKQKTGVTSFNVVLSDHANNARALNKWLQRQKKEKLESEDWFLELSNDQQVLRLL